jgi:hypothetical protein
MLLPISSANACPDASFANFIQLHEAVSYGVYVYSHLPPLLTRNIPIGYHSMISKDSDDLEEDLMRHLDVITLGAVELFKLNYPIRMTAENEHRFLNADKCYICRKSFENIEHKVRDHDHLKEFDNYRGAAHAKCNVLLRKRCFVPCYVHGLGSYDAHHLIKIFVAQGVQRINVIPCTIEKYVSFSIWLNGIELRFLDSYRLINTSLDQITSALPEDKFIETKKTFAPLLHALLKKKGPFPYSFLRDASSLDFEGYPERHWFKNDLTGDEITDSEYDRGRSIWQAAGCVKFSDFLHVYQCSDTTQLMDCVLYVRSLFWEKFKLDCAHFLSLPHLSLSAMLKHTGVSIELMTDDMQEGFEMIKRSIYGGLTSVGVRYVEADEHKSLVFCDANALYSFVMLSFPNAVGGYTFVDVGLHDWSKVDLDGDYGYFLEVDLSFPREIHDYLNCFPPVPERKKPPGGTTPRLIQDFLPKKDYVIAIGHFQLVLKLGVKCDRISRVLQYRQSNYMRAYVEVISKWRREAKSTCESNFFKMSLNSLYGKFNEVLERRRDLRVVTGEQQLEKLVRKGNFLERHIFHYPKFDLTLVEMAKGVVKQDRPNIVGAVILANSKVYMMRFWYDVLKRKFEHKNLKLLLTDTDSFIFSINTPTLVEDMLSIKEHFDFSNLPKDHALYSTENAKVFGKFKDESNGERILAFCSPRTKSYSLLYENAEMNKLKGIAKNFVKKYLHHEDYKKCVLEKQKLYATYKTIQSKNHNLYTVEINKLALEATDLKRVILADGINTLAYGHYALEDDETL